MSYVASAVNNSTGGSVDKHEFVHEQTRRAGHPEPPFGACAPVSHSTTAIQWGHA